MSGWMDHVSSGAAGHPGDDRLIRREWFVLLALLAAVFACYQVRLRSVLISDMDEGTYVYAGQLVERGLVPYRDFMLAHPPLIAFLVASWSHFFGSALMPLRAAYIALILASTLPLYWVVRRVTSARIPSLLAVVSYTSGMLFVANMGRTVRLEPLMNAFVIAGFGCRFLRPRSTAWMGMMGALFVAACFVKVIAVIPASLLLFGDVLWDRPIQPMIRRWLAAAAGAFLVLLPSIVWCSRQPRFFQDVVLGQVNRPRLGLGLRFQYLAQNIARDPPIVLGLLAALIFIVKARDARLRILGLTALGSTTILLFAFKTFFNYYIVQALPWIACCFAIAVDAAAAPHLGARWRVGSGALVVLLGLVLPLAYAEVYYRKGAYHVAGPRNIMPMLAGGDGFLYSMYPAFGLWTGRSIYPWYYRADSLVPRINNWIGDKDFIDVFSGSSALVLETHELDTYPGANDYVARNFVRRYRDADWSLWVRTGTTESPLGVTRDRSP